jgi:hypothetical protein
MTTTGWLLIDLLKQKKGYKSYTNRDFIIYKIEIQIVTVRVA